MRNEDINRYLPRIYSEAVRIKSRLSYNIELDDLISDGIIALLDYLNSGENQQEIDRKLKLIIRRGIIDDLRNMKKWVNLGKWYSLSRNEKLIFVLHNFENISFAEIAELLEISENQVKHIYG